MLAFVIYEKPQSWNTLARKNYWTYKKVFEAWHYLTHQALTAVKAKPINGPVRLVVVARWKGKTRRDVDNILLKPIIDAMVAYGVLSDDDTTNITEITTRGLTGQEAESLSIELISA